MRGVPAAALALALAAAASAGLAQSPPLRPAAGVAAIDQSRLITDTVAGRAIDARFQSASRALAAENRRIEAELEAEERGLTELRARVSPAEFQKLAAEFDHKVEGIRSAQETKSRSLTRQRDEERQRLVQRALPVLGQVMQARGAAVLIDRSAIVLMLEQADITDEVIVRLDALAAEEAPSSQPAEEPAPEPEPEAPEPDVPAPDVPAPDVPEPDVSSKPDVPAPEVSAPDASAASSDPDASAPSAPDAATAPESKAATAPRARPAPATAP